MMVDVDYFIAKLGKIEAFGTIGEQLTAIAESKKVKPEAPLPKTPDQKSDEEEKEDETSDESDSSGKVSGEEKKEEEREEKGDKGDEKKSES